MLGSVEVGVAELFVVWGVVLLLVEAICGITISFCNDEYDDVDDEDEICVASWCCGGECEYEIGVDALDDKVELAVVSSSAIGVRSELGGNCEASVFVLGK